MICTDVMSLPLLLLSLLLHIFTLKMSTWYDITYGILTSYYMDIWSAFANKSSTTTNKSAGIFLLYNFNI